MANKRKRKGYEDPYVRQANRKRRKEWSIRLGLSLLEVVIFATCYGILKQAGY